MISEPRGAGEHQQGALRTGQKNQSGSKCIQFACETEVERDGRERLPERQLMGIDEADHVYRYESHFRMDIHSKREKSADGTWP